MKRKVSQPKVCCDKTSKFNYLESELARELSVETLLEEYLYASDLDGYSEAVDDLVNGFVTVSPRETQPGLSNVYSYSDLPCNARDRLVVFSHAVPTKQLVRVPFMKRSK